MYCYQYGVSSSITVYGTEIAECSFRYSGDYSSCAKVILSSIFVVVRSNRSETSRDAYILRLGSKIEISRESIEFTPVIKTT